MAVLEQLESIPDGNVSFSVNNFKFETVEINGTRVKKVAVTSLQQYKLKPINKINIFRSIQALIYLLTLIIIEIYPIFYFFARSVATDTDIFVIESTN